MAKNWPKNRKWPSARNGQKWPKNGEKMGFGAIFLFFAIFCPFQAEGHFLFFGQFFAIFGFRPFFHSIPGGLTRNTERCFVATTSQKSAPKIQGQVVGNGGFVRCRKQILTKMAKMTSLHASQPSVGPATTQNLVVKFDGDICGGVLAENASDDFPHQKKLENLLPNFAGSSPPISPKTLPTSLWKSLVLTSEPKNR